MNAESLRRTLDTGRTWFWSRSRQEYWCKGETSGDRQYVREVRVDCDGDALWCWSTSTAAGACHTGSWSCFYRTVGARSRRGPSGAPGGVSAPSDVDPTVAGGWRSAPTRRPSPRWPGAIGSCPSGARWWPTP